MELVITVLRYTPVSSKTLWTVFVCLGQRTHGSERSGLYTRPSTSKTAPPLLSGKVELKKSEQHEECDMLKGTTAEL